MAAISLFRSGHTLPLVGALVLAILLLAAALNAWLLWQSQRDDRQQAVESTKQRATQLVGAVAERLRAVVRSVDFGLLQLRSAEGSGPGRFQARAESLFPAFPVSSLENAAVADADGNLIYSNSGPTGTINLRDRPHFSAHLAGGDKLVIGAPMMGGISKAWTIPFTRPVLEGGRFVGVALITLSPQRLSQVLASLELLPDDSIAVVNEDGYLLARNSGIDKLLGRAYKPARLILGPDAPPRGSFRGNAVTDGVDRFFAWRRVEGTGLVATVGLDAAQVMGPLEARHARQWWSAGLVSATLAGLGILVLDLLTRIARSQQTVADSETKLRRLIDGLGPEMFIGLLRTDGVLIEANRPALQAGGLELADVVGRPVEQTPWFAYSAEVQQQLREGISLAAAGVASRYDVQIQVADGRLVWLDFSLQPLRGEGGEISYLLPSAMVIEARKQAETQLMQLNMTLEQRVADRTAQLEAKSRELESFCYSVSHDLKAPLRGIDGYSRLLLDGYGDRLDDEGRLFAGNVRLAAQQMTSLIEDLLAYSRQERRNLSIEATELRHFVDQQINRRRGDFAAAELSVDVPEVYVAADHESLTMALHNLIDNAIKFSAHRERPLLKVRGRVEGARCVLSVQDNGAGFDMRFHDRIFEIFQRLHRVEDYPGTGIGLALVRKAAERMGGRVWAQSAPGAGATFHLELRLHDGPASGAAA